MKTATDTTVQVLGTLTGQFWWPIGEPWTKDIRETRRYVRSSHYYAGSETPDLRTLILDITNDGDSSSACLLTTDSVLVVKRQRGSRTYTRIFPLSLFPSIADLLETE